MPEYRKLKRSISKSVSSGQPIKKFRFTKIYAYPRNYPSRQQGYINGRYTVGTPGPEYKLYDIGQGSTTINSGVPYSNDLLYQIAEGSASYNRIGDKISVKSVDMIWNIRSVQYTSGYPQVVDLFLVLDKQPDAGSATPSTVFSVTNTNLTFVRTEQLDRFVILRREHVDVDQGGGVSKTVQWHVPLDVNARFADGTGSPQSNNLLVYALSPISGLTDQINISYIARVKFTDK